MTRQELQTEWLKAYCPTCENNSDWGTKYCNCQAEYEVEKDIGIACIHYEERKEYYDYERAVDQMEHDVVYEPTYNSEDGSM